MLDNTKIGILASRTILPHLTQQVIQTIQQIYEHNFILMGGWHSPMEEEIHKQLVKNQKTHIHFGAKSINRLFCKLGKEKVLFVTHCPSNMKRITRESALERNRLLCEMSDLLLVPWLDPKGKTHNIVREFCEKKLVYIFDKEYNAKLFKNGAKMMSFDFAKSISRKANANY